jgi:hypothetical protein
MALKPGLASRFAILAFFITSTCVFLALFFFPTIYADDSWETYIPKVIRPSQSRYVALRHILGTVQTTDFEPDQRMKFTAVMILIADLATFTLTRRTTKKQDGSHIPTTS